MVYVQIVMAERQFFLGTHTQVAVDDLAVVHLASHCPNLLQLCLLALHTVLQPLQFLTLRHSCLLTALLLFQVTQTLLLKRMRGKRKIRAHECK